MKKIDIKKIDLIRMALLLGAVAVILLILPREDHQSYSYELDQPWRYQLLTAEFDIPVLPDSAYSRRMRDSIERNFIPFVTYNPDVVIQNVDRFRKSVPESTPAHEVTEIVSLLQEVYNHGVVEGKTYDQIHRQPSPKVRLLKAEKGSNTAETLTAVKMLSPSKAFEYIDSAYSSHSESHHPLEGEVAKALNVCLTPNLISDPETDGKYRDEELVIANGARGMIKKGERIIDRGEIVDAKKFTNLNTYMERLARETEKNSKAHTYFYLGKGLYCMICFILLYVYLAAYRKRFYSSVKKMTFLTAFITLFVVFSILMFEYIPNGLYLVPFAAIPVIIMIFFDNRTAIFSLLITIMISALVAVDPLQFIFLEVLVGLVAAFSINQLTQRSQLLRTALFTLIAYSVGYIVMDLIRDGILMHFQWRMIGTFAVNAVILSFAYILILIIERLFGFTSTVTLVELSDINNKLLRKLAEEAPGTFQHSMQVSTLAAEAARAIGANTQLVRTGALYHDIGKMESPVFFTENQHGVNPHVGLNPETSAQKIISHVTGGLAMATKWKLPKVIRDFISEHHGKSVTRYFYNTAVNDNPDKTIDRSRFQYPGPNPQSKETAIVMMADAVEAASRSLKDYTPQAISDLVDKIIGSQEAEGLFKEAPISYKDVEQVKATFKKRLATIYHSRIAYPELHKKETTSSTEEAEKK